LHPKSKWRKRSTTRSRCTDIAGCSSVEEFVHHALEKEIKQFEGAESEEEIRQKLKGLSAFRSRIMPSIWERPSGRTSWRLAHWKRTARQSLIGDDFARGSQGGIHRMTSVVSIFNTAWTFLFGLIYGSLKWLGPFWSLVGISWIGGILMVWIFGKVSNQDAIKQTRARMSAELIALRLFKDDLKIFFGIQYQVLVWT
jgi:hypothetical protein